MTNLPRRIVKLVMPCAGRARHRPLQMLYGFAGVHSCLQVRAAGRTEASAPTGACRSALVRAELAGASCAGGACPAPALRRSPAQKKDRPGGAVLFHILFQHSFAPAGILSSTMMRFSFSSPCSVCTADSSIPQDSSPIILRGGRFTIATSVLPRSCSGS